MIEDAVVISVDESSFRSDSVKHLHWQFDSKLLGKRKIKKPKLASNFKLNSQNKDRLKAAINFRPDEFEEVKHNIEDDDETS